MKIRAFLLLTLLTLPVAATAASPDPELTKIVTELDAGLFKAFNECPSTAARAKDELKIRPAT